VSFHLPALPFTDPGPVFAVLLLAILLGPVLARLLRIPEVVAVVALGFVIGPTGLGLVERAGLVAMLGGAGLLYLMFVAGVELDLDDFVAHRRDSLGFGGLTFLVPMVLGTLIALGLGYGLLPALLLASCWASHTLVAYPVFQRVGTVGNRAVATSVGATIVTDTAALLVLAVVARASQGGLTPVFWATLLPSLALVTAVTVLGLPRLARWFFAGVGQQRTLRFLFVLVALFVVASVFEVVGIEAIVGAFLAGLALNRSIPNGGPLMERIDFVGATLLIPLFLVATGMLIDLRVLVEPRTLGVGVAFTAVAIVAKLLAAIATGRLFRYTGVEVAAMFSLSSAQAAATLAAVIVGLNVGLLTESDVNAVMMVILVTCVLASVVAGRVAPQLPRPVGVRDLGETVIVPVANPTTAPRLMRLASAFARTDGGLVVPVLVVPNASDQEQLDRARSLDDDMLAVAQSAGAEARSVLRIDVSPEVGIAHTVVEQQGSMLVLGWKGGTGRSDALFGGITDRVLSLTFVPTVIARESAVPAQRVLVVIDASVVTPGGRPALRLALRVAAVVGRAEGAPVEVVTNEPDRGVDELAAAMLGARPTIDARRRSIVVRDRARDGDVLVVPAIADEPHLRAVALRVMRAAPPRASVLVCVDNALADPRAIAVPAEDATISPARPRTERTDP
jgi:Kef-type K+ transport system membrane component KefB/nucleotide-binding universal stress UspA family protein